VLRFTQISQSIASSVLAPGWRTAAVLIAMYRSFIRRALFVLLSVAVPIFANGLRALGLVVLAHLEGSSAAVEADHILYGWLFFSLVIMVLTAIGMLAAVLLASAGPAYAARLNALSPASPLLRAERPAIAAPWHIIPEPSVGWRPAVSGADAQYLDAAQEPGAGIVVRYVALYRLRATGNLLTTTENRLVDDLRWHVARYGHAEISVDGKKTTVTTAEIVDGPRRRLVWSFYVAAGRITSGILETKLLQARAVLLDKNPVAAFVAVSASMDDPKDPAERQLTRFLAANAPFPRYLASLTR
jgi:EpsI family protein